MEKIEGQTLEEIASALFDEMGYKDGDELTIDKTAYMTDVNTGSTDSSLGEQETSKESKASEPDRASATERLYTKTEMDQAILESEKKPAPVENKIPDLTPEELILLSEQDDQDKTGFTTEYLKRKMLERNLSEHELEKLKAIDDGADLYGQYIAAKTKREVYSELNPLLAPIQAEQQQRQVADYQKNEKAINDSNDVEFGADELATLRKKISDPKFVEAVIKQSSLGNIILNEWNNGSKAMSHKQLLREAKLYEAKITQGKKEKSVSADIGASGNTQRKADKAGTIEEAFDLSVRELNL